MADPALTDRISFGAWLRRERERRGLTLDTIASRTKIAGTLLAGLEAGDLSRWPTGIFRRAFVRAYAEALGLDPDYILAEFTIVHPDEGQAVVTVPRRLTTGAVRADALRLTLDEASRRPWREPRRMAGAAVDAVVVAVVLAGLWTAGPGLAGMVVAWLLLAGYAAVGVLALDSTPGLWLAGRLAARRAAAQGSLGERSAGLDAEATVVPFQRGRQRRRRRSAMSVGRATRASGEGRARTH